MAEPVAVQLYTLRFFGSLDQRLAAVAGAGYDGVETLGSHDLEAGALKAKLAEHGLAVCSSHSSPHELFGDLETVLRFNETLGNDVVVLPWLGQSDRPNTAAGWRELGERVGELARRTEAAGMRLLYHNHDFEMKRFEGERALDLLVEAAGDALGLELDLAWAVRGGEDPLELLGRYRTRVPRVHVKDLAAQGAGAEEGGWADVGHGRLDWSTLLSAARDAGAEWFVVEHDEPRDPLRTITRSLETVRTLSRALSHP